MITAFARRKFCCSQVMSGSRRKFDSVVVGIVDELLLLGLRECGGRGQGGEGGDEHGRARDTGNGLQHRDSPLRWDAGHAAGTNARLGKAGIVHHRSTPGRRSREEIVHRGGDDVRRAPQVLEQEVFVGPLRVRLDDACAAPRRTSRSARRARRRAAHRHRAARRRPGRRRRRRLRVPRRAPRPAFRGRAAAAALWREAVAGSRRESRRAGPPRLRSASARAPRPRRDPPRESSGDPSGTSSRSGTTLVLMPPSMRPTIIVGWSMPAHARRGATAARRLRRRARSGSRRPGAESRRGPSPASRRAPTCRAP